MRGRTADPVQAKKSKGRNTHLISKAELDRSREGDCRIIPDIFKVAVRGLSCLLFCGQIELFRKLPQSCSMEDPCQDRHKDNQHQWNHQGTYNKSVFDNRQVN